MTASATSKCVFTHVISLNSTHQRLSLLYQAITAKTLLQSAVSVLLPCVLSVKPGVLRVTVVGLANIGYSCNVRIAWPSTATGFSLLILLGAKSTTTIAYHLPIA
jgi:hypothetical protein